MLLVFLPLFAPALLCPVSAFSLFSITGGFSSEFTLACGFSANVYLAGGLSAAGYPCSCSCLPLCIHLQVVYLILFSLAGSFPTPV